MTYHKKRYWNYRRYISSVNGEKQKSKARKNRQTQYDDRVCDPSIIKCPACEVQQTACYCNDLFTCKPIFSLCL